jgi:glucan 1,4-alpha-glucosidase
MNSRVLGVLAGAAVVLGALASTAAAAPTTNPAPGAPGDQSYFDLARKDCVGTARNTHSKVWFTVADGVLSDTYWPTVDATNVHTLQYLVTDGRTFTDLQTRDMQYRVIPDPTGMSCTVVASNAAHQYSITTTYIADPSRDAVLMNTRFRGPGSDHLYVRLDPLAGGTGGGGAQNAGPNSAVVDAHNVPVAFNTNTITNASNRDYAVPTYMALESSDGFSTASVGYSGTGSDGVAMLDASHSLTAQYDSAPDGHVTLTAELARGSHDPAVTLALGFGTTQSQAESVAGKSVKDRFDDTWSDYEHQWARYDQGLRRPSFKLGSAAVREYYESVNVVKASEDKTFPGAIAAGLASPWGQAVPAGNFANGVSGPPNYFGSYREVFARDLYEAFAGLLVAGDIQTARDATLFLFERQQQPDGSMPRNSLENGKVAPDTGGLQLDETSYPILMAWQSGLARYPGLYTDHVRAAADFLVAHGPSDGVERWEEQSGFSPSTIAAEIAGLTAASHIARVNNDPVRARLYQATADYFARNIKTWTVTDTGPYGTGTYFLRLSKTGNPNVASPYNLGNGSITDDQRRIVDQGFLELVRLGVLPASDPDVQASLKVIDSVIKVNTPSGAGFYRYGTDATGSEDGYGDCHVADSTNCTIEGKPWPTFDPGAGHGGSGNVGSGHLWPVLGGERGEYDVAAGNPFAAGTFLTAMRNTTSGQGLEPEQAWEDADVAASPFGSDPTSASIGFVDGEPTGSASPLTWAQSQYARLALALSTGRDLETPGIVTRRYVTRGMPAPLDLTITSPANNTRVTSATVAVTGTSVPGARIDAEGLGAAGGVAGTASAVADGMGNWSLVVPTGFGSTVITVTATLGGSTGHSQLTVINAELPGTTVLDAADPGGDDNGPGTYQYPTDPSFTAGSFDLTDLKVNADGTNVYIQVSIAKLVPTFGNDFGAQLLDVYVHNPGLVSTSGNAAQPTFNYNVAPAWSERLEAQGFAAPVWVDASGASLGNAAKVIDEPSQTATLIVPESVFGAPGSGWAFAVALTGQDGFSSDQARAFAPTPQPFAFGVCAPGGSSPICTFDPTKVPKVMDTVTPAGASQATELNPTLGPVVLQGVSVP